MPHLVFLRGGEDVDKSKLRSYLENGNGMELILLLSF